MTQSIKCVVLQQSWGGLVWGGVMEQVAWCECALSVNESPVIVTAQRNEALCSTTLLLLY